MQSRGIEPAAEDDKTLRQPLSHSRPEFNAHVGDKIKKYCCNPSEHYLAGLWAATTCAQKIRGYSQCEPPELNPS